MKNTKKKIFYEKEVKFYVVPNMIINDMFEFKKHILHIRTEYQIQYQKDCFFWDFDEKTNSIIVNENAYAIENDIFNQLILLTHWSFNKNYRIKGSYHSRTGNTIEYISMNGNDTFICHHVLVDSDTTENIINIDSLTDDIGNRIITDAKNKIKKHIDLQKIIKNNNRDDFNNVKFNKNIISKIIIQNKPITPSNFTNRSSNSYDNKEINLVIESIQKRVTELENRQKTQSKLNKFFFRTFTIIGLLTAGSLICFSMMKQMS
jgi:hypothetical protein